MALVLFKRGSCLFCTTTKRAEWGQNKGCKRSSFEEVTHAHYWLKAKHTRHRHGSSQIKCDWRNFVYYNSDVSRIIIWYRPCACKGPLAPPLLGHLPLHPARPLPRYATLVVTAVGKTKCRICHVSSTVTGACVLLHWARLSDSLVPLAFSDYMIKVKYLLLLVLLIAWVRLSKAFTVVAQTEFAVYENVQSFFMFNIFWQSISS